MSTPINKYIPDLSKLEPLDRTNYCYWYQMMVIFFEQLQVNYVLFNPPAIEKSEDSAIVFKDFNVTATKAKFENDKKWNSKKTVKL
ncbi:hypothetical protein J1N35_021924 [Gossypium stocksii]|uniref:Uncharacterized protein n=1 Tax=Gossypium stocksii TaxID=47602 RepID=A0A9D4A1S4_9ROSI|nr:hypothetical protein J1N35_021924 [Gossypium stocksii]